MAYVGPDYVEIEKNTKVEEAVKEARVLELITRQEEYTCLREIPSMTPSSNFLSMLLYKPPYISIHLEPLREPSSQQGQVVNHILETRWP